MAAIPVILDTDIGSDIDDTWALAQLLRSPELDLRLITSCTGDTVYRAKLCARLLEVAGRHDVPVAVGRSFDELGGSQAAWVTDFDLTPYRHPKAGAEAIVETVMGSDAPITIISIGPLPNIADALALEPRIAERAIFVGMHGSVYLDYDGKPGAVGEYNVAQDVASAQAVFAAPWQRMVITPLDTCGRVVLDGELYARVCASRDPLAQAVIENYRLWRIALNQPAELPRSSTLFDTVAVHLAHSRAYLRTEMLGIAITDDGLTVPDATARPIEVALSWSDMAGFNAELVARLVGEWK